VGGGGNCAVDTEVSKQSNVGRDETMVGSSKVMVGHIVIANLDGFRCLDGNFLENRFCFFSGIQLYLSCIFCAFTNEYIIISASVSSIPSCA